MSNTNVRIREQEAARVATAPRQQEQAATVIQTKEQTATADRYHQG